MLSDEQRNQLAEALYGKQAAVTVPFLHHKVAAAVEQLLAAQRETIAAEIEAARTNCDSARTVCDYCRGLNDAAAIARGGAQ